MMLPPRDEIEARVVALQARMADGSLQLIGSSVYTEAKGLFIDETTALAQAWADATRWQP